MTRLEFIQVWKEHRERHLLTKYDGDPRLGPKLARVPHEGSEFWKIHKAELMKLDVNEFFARVIRAHEEALKA